MDRIKVLFIIDELGIGGGAEKQLVYLALGIDKKAFEVYLCSLGDFPSEYLKVIQNAGIGSFNLYQKGLIDVRCLNRLTRLVGELRPHIVNTFLFTSDTYGRLSAILGKVPIIVTSVRNIDLWKKSRHLFVDRILEKRTTHFTANAGVIKRYLEEKLHIAPDKISVIYNGIDSEKFRKFQPAQNIYTDLNIREGNKIILSICRFWPQKDHITLIEALKIVLKNRSDVEVILVGEGPLRDRILRIVEQSGLRERFRVLDCRYNVVELYNVSTLSLLTSLYEGCSNFILESMACELPVVATSAGGNSELVVEGKTGFLANPQDYEKIAEQILYLLDNPQVALEFGRAARKKIEEGFSLKTMVEAYEKLYQGLYLKHCHLG
jgi:glycosyltransferase involved in cell wall biosynthesis